MRFQVLSTMLKVNNFVIFNQLPQRYDCPAFNFKLYRTLILQPVQCVNSMSNGDLPITIAINETHNEHRKML